MTRHSTRRCGRRAALVCLLVSVTPATTLARSSQATSATVTCVVRDASDAVLAGATVILTNIDTGQKRQKQSERDGITQFLGVQPGRYRLDLSLDGFESEERLFELTIDQSLQLRVALTIAARKMSTDIIATDQPLIEPSKTSLGRTITRQETDSLPLPAGLIVNFPSLAVLTPGITTDSAGSGLATAGQTGSNNTFYLDSLSIDSALAGGYTVNLPLEAVKEFRIVSNHPGAEFGQASGAIVNIVTRSGTNELAGRAYYFQQNSSWNPTSAAARLAGTTDPGYAQILAGGFLSGPLVHDRAFAFGAVEQGDQQTSYVDTSPVIAAFRPLDPLSWPINVTFPKLFIRTDFNLGRSNVLTVRGDNQVNRSNDSQREDQSAAERGRSLANHLWTLGGFDTHVIGSSAVNEIRTQVMRGDLETSVSGFCPGCAALNYLDLKLGKPSNAPQQFLSERAQAADVVSWLVGRGRHTLKAGIDLDFTQQSGMNPNNTAGTYTFQTDRPFDASDASTYPVRFTQNVGDPSFVVHETILSVYGQDEWRVSNGVAITAGIRWDHTAWPDPAVTRDDVAPRVGVSVDPWKTGVTVFRAAAGRYYDESQLNIARDSQTGFVQVSITNPGFSGDPQSFDAYAPSPKGSTVQYSVNRATAIQTPYTDQVSVGMQRQVRPSIGFSIDLVRALGYHLPVGGDLNYPDPVTHLRPDPTIGQIIVTQTRGQSWYTGLQIGVRVRPSRVYSGSVAYTLASSENDTDGRGSIPQDQNDILADRGPASTDARHRVAASGVLELPYDCRLSALLNATSALPYNETTGNVDKNGDGVFGNERLPGVGRNSERGSPYFNLDLRFSKAIVFGKSRVELLIEAFNATNHDNWTGYTFVVGRSSFGKPANAGPPRQMQVGARITF